MVPRDLTMSQDVLNAGWRGGGIYVTMRPVFLINDRNNMRHYLARSNANHIPETRGHQCGSGMVPRSLAQYEQSLKNWQHIERVLPVGSRVKFYRMSRSGGLYGLLYPGLTSLSINGTLLGETDISVDLSCISINDFDKQLYTRDNAWLRDNT